MDVQNNTLFASLDADRSLIPASSLKVITTGTSIALLGKEFGIDFDEKRLHDALEDLKLNVAVWNKLKWQIEL